MRSSNTPRRYTSRDPAGRPQEVRNPADRQDTEARCRLDRTLYARVVFSDDGKVSGLQFTPSGPPGEFKPPAYVKRDAFKEVEVQVGAGEWALPGTLAVPAGAGPLPAVVLVHGSGPN